MMDAFAELGVSFAFPSRTVYVASLPDAKAPGPVKMATEQQL
jgi:hypothetical protein